MSGARVMKEVDLYRHSHLIDPTPHFWGWEVPVYLFLGGLAAGIMILSAVLVLRGHRLSRWARYSPFVAPVAISLGMGALFLDLEHKLYVWRFFLALMPRSPMSWGSWILLAIYPATFMLGLALLTSEESALATRVGLGRPVRWLRGLAAGRLRFIAWANIVLGASLGAYTGVLIGTLAARGAWGSVFLAPLFLASGISAGAALMMLFPLEREEHHLLRRWDLVAIGAEVILIMLYLLDLVVAGGEHGRRAAGLFLGGEFTAVFWTLVFFAGLAAPFVLELVETKRELRPTVMAPALILVGGLALRFVITFAGQA